MKFTYYGHSCFAVGVNGKKLLFDPFITGNELARHIDVNSIEADFILISHGHGDHLADAISIAQRTNALVIAAYEVCNWVNTNGYSNTHPMNTGGNRDFGFGKVRCVVAQHSSQLPDGSYGGNPLGFVVTSTEGNFYYAGDTGLTLDMQLIPKWAKLNFAVLPIGDNFTMGAEDAAEAARMVDCHTVVGVHYDTFGYIKTDHALAMDIFSKAGATLLLPKIGETISI